MAGEPRRRRRGESPDDDRDPVERPPVPRRGHLVSRRNKSRDRRRNNRRARRGGNGQGEAERHEAEQDPHGLSVSLPARTYKNETSTVDSQVGMWTTDNGSARET